MIAKDHLLAEMLRDCDICLHLFAKLPPEALSYRPSPGQRTTLELLRYLSICGIVGLRCMGERNWGLYPEFQRRSAEMPPDGFPAAMNRQKQEIAAFFAAVDEKTLETQPAPLPQGGELPLGLAILGGPFKWLTAYKMQLFLYAKCAGAADIGTANVWGGVDRAP